MKNYTKLLSLFLAALMILFTLISCDTKTPSQNSSEETIEHSEDETVTVVDTGNSEASETEHIIDIEKKNYNDSFFLSIFSVDNPIAYHWVEEGSNDAMSESIYHRQMNIYDHLGVEVVGFPTGTYEDIMTSVKNKDGSIDTLVAHAYLGIPGYITGGYLRDFNDVDQINLDADYWNYDYMDELSLDGKMYVGYSDFNIPKIYVISFNKDMMSKYKSEDDNWIYDTVSNYKWTLDEMIALANLVSVDSAGDGKTHDDTYGITGNQWIPFSCFVEASGIQLVDINQAGVPEVSVYNEFNANKTVTLVDKLSELAKSNSAWFWYRTEATPQIHITSGRTLMMLQQSFDLINNLSYDIDFGIIPYPMYDETQKDIGYRTQNWGGSLVIPSYVENSEMVGDTLELLAYYSEDVAVTFYEKLLGKQVADAPEDRKMLDIVWDSVCSDLGLTYSHLTLDLDKILYMMPTLTYEFATEEPASYVKSYEVSCNRSLSKFMKTLGARN